MSSESAVDPSNNEIITCRLTSWYVRRVGLLAAAVLAMGCYFLYDGRWGYPKKNKIAEQKEWYVAEVVGSYKEAASQGNNAVAQWLTEARKKGWIVDPNLTQPQWHDYAAPRGWAAEPRKYTPAEIQQQFWIGWAMVAAAAIMGMMLVVNRNKTLVGHADRMILPNGKTVRFADAFKIDTRKWDNKGLAYVYSREPGRRSAHKATIDDLKFHPAEQVLKRLLSQFQGELIAPAPESKPTQTAEGKSV